MQSTLEQLASLLSGEFDVNSGLREQLASPSSDLAMFFDCVRWKSRCWLGEVPVDLGDTAPTRSLHAVYDDIVELHRRVKALQHLYGEGDAPAVDPFYLAAALADLSRLYDIVGDYDTSAALFDESRAIKRRHLVSQNSRNDPRDTGSQAELEGRLNTLLSFFITESHSDLLASHLAT